MKSFTEPEWENIFKEAGYRCFDDWWNAEQNLVETGNFRGPDANTSWSHVSRIKLPGERIIYLKRQQNHYPINILLKLRKICTFEIEWQNYQMLRNAGVPTMNIIHYACRKINGDKQCIIISEELKDMSPLNELIQWFQKNGWPGRKQRLAILGAVLKVIRTLHEAGLIHNALYGTHIYVNIPFENGIPQMPAEFKACLIDLERTKSTRANSPKFIKHDLEKMYRRNSHWPARDCLWFFKQYLGISKLTPEAKKTTLRIAATRRL